LFRCLFDAENPQRDPHSHGFVKSGDSTAECTMPRGLGNTDPSSSRECLRESNRILPFSRTPSVDPDSSSNMFSASFEMLWGSHKTKVAPSNAWVSVNIVCVLCCVRLDSQHCPLACEPADVFTSIAKLMMYQWLGCGRHSRAAMHGRTGGETLPYLPLLSTVQIFVPMCTTSTTLS